VAEEPPAVAVTVIFSLRLGLVSFTSAWQVPTESVTQVAWARRMCASLASESVHRTLTPAAGWPLLLRDVGDVGLRPVR
jgi:hypothetical protein